MRKIILLINIISISCTQLPTVYIPADYRISKKENKLKTSPPHLEISVNPKFLMPGSQVVAIVRIVGAPITENFYCQKITWNWGDDNISTEQSDCTPLVEGNHIRTLYSKNHEYRSPGEMKITFTLGKYVISSNVTVFSASKE